MGSERERKPFDDGNGGQQWIVEADVVSVKPLTTKYGSRLLLNMQGPEGQAPVWVDDSPENRKNLNMVYTRANTPRDYDHQTERQEAADSYRRHDDNDPDGEIPF